MKTWTQKFGFSPEVTLGASVQEPVSRQWGVCTDVAQTSTLRPDQRLATEVCLSKSMHHIERRGYTPRCSGPGNAQVSTEVPLWRVRTWPRWLGAG